MFFSVGEGRAGKAPKITTSYPFAAAAVSTRYPNILRFCFPEPEGAGSGDEISFTFVMTDENGRRMYGHTTRTVIGVVYCFLSRFPWCNFFYNAISIYRQNYEDLSLVRLLHHTTLPGHGELFVAGTADPHSHLFNSLHLRRPDDTDFAFIDTSPHVLVRLFTFDQLFRVLAALLTERHIAVCARDFGIVSRVCMSLLALLHPFEWQHVLIPVVPTELLEVIAAPTPFLVGTLSSELTRIAKIPTDDLLLIVVSSDGKTVSLEGETSSIPSLPRSSFPYALRMTAQKWYYSPQNSWMRTRSAPNAPSQEQLGSVKQLLNIIMNYYADLFGAVVPESALPSDPTGNGDGDVDRGDELIGAGGTVSDAGSIRSSSSTAAAGSAASTARGGEARTSAGPAGGGHAHGAWGVAVAAAGRGAAPFNREGYLSSLRDATCRAFVAQVCDAQLFDTLLQRLEHLFLNGEWVYDAFCRAMVAKNAEAYPTLAMQCPDATGVASPSAASLSGIGRAPSPAFAGMSSPRQPSLSASVSSSASLSRSLRTVGRSLCVNPPGGSSKARQGDADGDDEMRDFSRAQSLSNTVTSFNGNGTVSSSHDFGSKPSSESPRL